MIGYYSLVILCLAQLSFAQLPPGVTICPKAEPSEFNKCVLKQLDILNPYLAKGIPAMKLPALDPLFLPSLSIDRNLEALNIKANLSQIQVFGTSNFVVDEIDAKPEQLAVYFKIHFPEVQVRGNYDVQGRLLLLPLTGIGSFKGNFFKTEVRANARGKAVTDSSGVKRIVLDTLQIKIRVGDGNIRLQAAPAHRLTADAAAAFFNSNPRLVLDIASPIVEDTVGTISRALVTRALSVFSKDQLVPF